jgi:surface protein
VGREAFNQDISTWDTANVTNMINMFRQATVFYQDIHTWSVLNVTNADYIFCLCPNMLAEPLYRPRFIPAPIWGCS